MTNHAASLWSDSLQRQTRDAIEEISLSRDGCLHFKHATLGYASVTLDELMNGRLVLRSRTRSALYRFDDVEALLQAGWAVD